MSASDHQQQPEGATTVFILGLLGMILCPILGPIAWVQGNSYTAECRNRRVEPEGLGVAGRILGIIATVLLILGVVIVVLTFMFPVVSQRV